MRQSIYSLRVFIPVLLITAAHVSDAAREAASASRGNIHGPVITAEGPTNEAVIVKLPNGQLKLFYIGRTKDKVESISSSDHGVTWTAPEVEFALPGKAYYAIQVLLDREHELQAVFHIRGQGDNGYRGRHYNLWHCRTRDGRKAWTEPKEFFQGYVGSIRGFIQLKSGRLLVAAAIAVPARAQEPKHGPDYGWNDSVTFYSDDNGQTWKPSDTRLKVLQDNRRGLTRYGGVEPHLIELPDGRVWMLIRTKNGFLYESFSDDGVTWSPPRPTQFIASDSPAEATRLVDGRIVLLFNSCQRWDDLRSYAIGGRETLHAAISDDDGNTWHGFREILKVPEDLEGQRGDRGTAYPSAVQADNGNVVVFSGQGEAQRFIVVFDPDWLMEQTGGDDFRDGTSHWTYHGSQTTRVIPHPDDEDRNILSVHKKSADDTAGAVFNFPMLQSGVLRLRLKSTSGNGQVQLALTDHFSVVNDTQANENAIFAGTLALKPGPWNDVVVEWTAEAATVTVDGKEATLQPKRPMVWGVNYLRLICPDDGQPGRVDVEHVKVSSPE